MVSHPETGSDSPIGSDQYRGRDITIQKIPCLQFNPIQKISCFQFNSENKENSFYLFSDLYIKG